MTKRRRTRRDRRRAQRVLNKRRGRSRTASSAGSRPRLTSLAELSHDDQMTYLGCVTGMRPDMSPQELRLRARTALELLPDSPAALMMLVLAAADSAELVEAVQGSMRRLRRVGLTAKDRDTDRFGAPGIFDLYLRLLEAYIVGLLDLERGAEALESLAELRRVNPGNSLVWQLELKARLGLGEHDAMRTGLAARVVPRCCRLYGEALLAFLDEGDSDRARAALERAWQHDPGRGWVDPERARLGPKGRSEILSSFRQGDVCWSEDLWTRRPDAVAWLAERRDAAEPAPAETTLVSTDCSIEFLERVPVAPKLRDALLDLVARTDRVCLARLDGQYRLLCRVLARRLAEHYPRALRTGLPASRAAGVATVIARANALSSDDTDPPTMTLAALADAFGVSPATARRRADAILAGLGGSLSDVTLQRPSRIEEDRQYWMARNSQGELVDMRCRPYAEAELAVREQKIPFVPGDPRTAEEYLARLCDFAGLTTPLDFPPPFEREPPSAPQERLQRLIAENSTDSELTLILDLGRSATRRRRCPRCRQGLRERDAVLVLGVDGMIVSIPGRYPYCDPCARMVVKESEVSPLLDELGSDDMAISQVSPIGVLDRDWFERQSPPLPVETVAARIQAFSDVEMG